MKISLGFMRSADRNTAIFIIVVLSAAVFTGCNPPTPLASWQDGSVTGEALDQALLEMPEAARIRPLEMSHGQWAENHIRAFALQQILSEQAHEAMASEGPDFRARRFWREVSALAAVLDLEILDAITVSQAQIDEATTPFVDRKAEEPLLTFSHIFVRLDRHGQEGARRRMAEAVAALDSGEDFADVARRYSDSAVAGSGGLIANAKESDLEATVAVTLAELEEGETSTVLKTRTGLHIVRLERRLFLERASDDQFVQRIEGRLRRQAAQAAHDELLEDLRSTDTLNTDSWPWQVGSWTVDAELAVILMDFTAQQVTEDSEQALVDQLLLADEARRRGLQTADFEKRLEQAIHQEEISRIYRDAWKGFTQSIPDSTLRAAFEAQPSRFFGPETANVELIFVPQGRDSFATQQMMEQQVARLRSGEVIFADLAGRLSTGPRADHGGDLGALKPPQWAQLSPVLHSVISGAEQGAISDPIYLTDRILSRSPIRGGFAVVRVTDHRMAESAEFADVVEQVRAIHVQNFHKELQQAFHDKVLAEKGFELHRIPSPAELGL
jgi:parvulin-like peptidyl-prolyl isomerase